MTATGSLAALVRPGQRIALADGVGGPRSVSKHLSEVAATAGGVRLLLGWLPAVDGDLDLSAFADVRTFMGGWGLREAIAEQRVRALPVRLGAVPALLGGPLRPDVLIATVVETPTGFRFATEVCWLRAAVRAGARVAAVVSTAVPTADAGDVLPSDQVTVIGECGAAPLEVATAALDDDYRQIGRHVAGLVPAGARLQVGPGPLGAATTAALERPVQVDSGMLIDGVADLDARGLLTGTPRGTYLSGTQRLYRWADGRRLLHPVELTHDLGRLAAPGLVAVNTALEVDLDGNVNVEGTADSVVGGVGGHADYATAANRSPDGVSVIALPAAHRGVPTLVERLSRPVTTPGHDVDVVVTERGRADLRGLDRVERRRALLTLWDGAVRKDGG